MHGTTAGRAGAGAHERTVPTDGVLRSDELAAFLALVHPDDRDRVTDAIARAVAAEADDDVAFRVVAPDGRAPWTAALAAGRAGHLACDRGTPARTEARWELAADLRRAVERGELALLYQPRVELATGRIEAVEALVRWRHPRHGPLAPADFVPLAEETGLIVPIGQGVLAAACGQAAAWRAQRPGAPPPRVCVNLSPRQFRQPDLAGQVARTLARAGLDPPGLELEITERVVVEEEHALRALGALKALGVRLAIDDFGTGYSSLSYLHRLPADALKLDRSFVREVAHDARMRAVVRAVAALAHELGLEVVAEGVETAEQLAWARALGCDQGQGYHFARPLPAEAVGRLLASPAPPWAGPGGPAPAETAPHDGPPPVRVLVVDDDPLVRDTVRRCLELEGYEVALAEDGRAALAAAARERPDLVVLDWLLPGLDGLGVAMLLREPPATARLPILLLTGRADAADTAVGRGAGAEDYLAKPFAVAELLARVAALLRRAGGERPGLAGSAATTARPEAERDAPLARAAQPQERPRALAAGGAHPIYGGGTGQEPADAGLGQVLG